MTDKTRLINIHHMSSRIYLWRPPKIRIIPLLRSIFAGSKLHFFSFSASISRVPPPSLFPLAHPITHAHTKIRIRILFHKDSYFPGRNSSFLHFVHVMNDTFGIPVFIYSLLISFSRIMSIKIVQCLPVRYLANDETFERWVHLRRWRLSTDPPHYNDSICSLRLCRQKEFGTIKNPNKEHYQR